MNNHTDNLFDAQAPLEDETLWELLSLYVDGEADPAQAEIVEQMLRSDPACRRDFDFLMQTSKTMRLLEEVAPPLGLREAIYAGTVLRPTLAGRLRAAWNRATTPAVGRYASVGGAFAAAAIGALLVWPRLNSTPAPGRPAPAEVVINVPYHAVSATNEGAQNSTTARIPDVIVAKTSAKTTIAVKGASRELKAVTFPPKTILASHSSQAAEKQGIKQAMYTPQNHPLLKHSPPRIENPDMVQITYAYDKKMDEIKTHGQSETIVDPKPDFGPMVVTNEETPHAGGTITDKTVATDGAPPVTQPQPATTRTVYVAALPPNAIQNISAAAIRHDMSARYDGYDRSVAASIQRHEIMVPMMKGSF